MKGIVKTKQNSYEVEEVGCGVYAIDDPAMESMYLINGTKGSLLIDTGMMDESLRPVVNALGGQKTQLALTHAHIDHLYHADEFRTVYMYREEFEHWSMMSKVVAASAVGFKKKVKRYDIRSWIPLTDREVIDLGDKKIRVLPAPGHTPGSCIYVDEADQLLFTGDAFGSGSGAWMWMPGCLNVSAYRDSLEKIEEELKPYENFRFLGGHRKQSIPTKEVPHAWTLDMELVKDMHELCSLMLDGKVKPVNEMKVFGMKAKEYEYNHAATWVRESQIR